MIKLFKNKQCTNTFKLLSMNDLEHLEYVYTKLKIEWKLSEISSEETIDSVEWYIKALEKNWYLIYNE